MSSVVTMSKLPLGRCQLIEPFHMTETWRISRRSVAKKMVVHALTVQKEVLVDT